VTERVLCVLELHCKVADLFAEDDVLFCCCFAQFCLLALALVPKPGFSSALVGAHCLFECFNAFFRGVWFEFGQVRFGDFSELFWCDF